jgi:hypothetical protein
LQTPFKKDQNHRLPEFEYSSNLKVQRLKEDPEVEGKVSITVLKIGTDL